ncbi:MAG: response regulator, partial [Candidatus Sulfotelmatobacter sp.]
MARKILLADDSVTAQNMGRKILADAGYEVFAVNNGSAALKKIAEIKPDLVILDVYMPGYSGLEVCQRLKESHDSAHIPVLLSVGKLEPFKPEEAQRVRAEGYIVKPFEASELLSALSKLEDKVVPRAEPSKPGRFARAVAAAEEVSRAVRSQSGEENGWKSRIGFPHQKAEPEEKVADDAAIYNPVNRDLRTVVETPAELAADRAAEQEQKLHHAESAAEGAETNVDVAALAPAGLPKDVTPEEVAAIAAAAAQIQMLNATIKDEPKPSDKATNLNPQSTSALNSEPTHESGEESKIESARGEIPAPVTHQLRNQDDQEEKPQDLPVTMAATTEATTFAHEGASRWTAVSVALEGDEAAISLDQEMQKVYAAFAAEVSASEAASAAASENSATPAEPHLPVAAMSNPELHYASQPQQVVTADPRQTQSTPSAPSEAVVSFAPAEPIADSPQASLTQSRTDISSTVTEPVAALDAPSEARNTQEVHAGETHSEPQAEPQPAAASREPVAELADSP